MTTTKSFLVESRKKKVAAGPVTGASVLSQKILEQVKLATTVKFPSPKYRADPVAFFREVLGVDPWYKQIEIIEAIRDHPRGAVKSGHKVSKSHTIAGTALWFYCSYEDARVILSSTTARQVDQILWRELRMMKFRSGRCVECKREDPEQRYIVAPCPHSAIIDGDPAELARSGLKSNFREIVGFTAREAEAVAGISGKNLLYLLDEASGIPDQIFEAVEGNRAGGARMWMFGNPTKTTGEFFEAFNDKKDLYHGITVSSEETPNVVSGENIIPGLATRSWIEEKKEEWGEESGQYKIRVKGEFATKEDGKIFSVDLIKTAEDRRSENEFVGRLFIGVDPAGGSGKGDESVFTPRRGLYVADPWIRRGLDEDAHLVQLLAMINSLKKPREPKPVVVLDREGAIGSAVFGTFRAFLESVGDEDAPFVLVPVRASDGAQRKPEVYDRMRDDLTGNLYDFIFKLKGSIYEDVKLEAELHFMEWKEHKGGKLKVTPKELIYKELRRSPDRYDSLALCCWEPNHLIEDFEPDHTEDEEGGVPILDPYAGSRAWERR